MKWFKMGAGCAACTVMLAMGPVTHAWASEGWTEEKGQWFYYDDGSMMAGRWLYDDENDAWYYFDNKGVMYSGRLELDGETYFMGEDGKMLTGWISCPRDMKPSPHTSNTMEDHVFYAREDGKMAKGWAEALSPEDAVLEQGEVFERRQDGGYTRRWYCFKENGKIYYRTKENVGGKLYIFDGEGRPMTGWIYDRGEGQSPRYVKVDDETLDSERAEYNKAPDFYMYGLQDDNSLAVSRWFDSVKPGDKSDADKRSYYASSSGYIVTNTAKDSEVSVAARRKATKIKEMGSYEFENWSTDVNLVRINGKYYCIEDSGTRIDGMIYLQGGQKGQLFPGGFYCFMDNAALQTGYMLKENKSDDYGSDGYSYYYYFSEDTKGGFYKGQGVTGVSAGRLYYQGMAVAAQEENYEVVYLPTVAEQSSYGTGMFLVDESGRVMKGSKSGNYYTASDGNKYKIVKEHDRDDTYGYHIFTEEKDESGNKVLSPVTDDEAEYIYWDAVEE
ncbi:MAG: hypothetical protein QM657_04705 [Lacrimispora sp.]|uniref:hypothetical protein n=1 Tax=Lacrimispora sp. TaxID=2719234 RepID=UPI0039E49617